MRRFRLAGLCLVPLLWGCFGVDPSSPPSGGQGPAVASGPQGDGKLFIQWTLGGQPPSDTSCAGVDQLRLSLVYVNDSVTIEPIPCTLNRFRYDGLPAGVATLQLDALDAQGCRVARGIAPDTLTPTLPDTPQPTVALSAVRACR